VRIIIATDAWSPQINGVARTLMTTTEELRNRGHEVIIVEPSQFSSISNPFYKEIPFCYFVGGIAQYIKPPCAIHIATEGSIGLAFNWYCRRNNIPFTTSYHTNYPDYLQKYLYVPPGLTYAYLRWFHNGARNIMVSTQTLQTKLEKRGFKNIKRWSRGVDLNLFKPGERRKGSKCLYVGRVAKEKNIEAFLNSKLDIEKIVVGSGPHLNTLKRKYPSVTFLGALYGEQLAEAYRNADCFVFPSKTDTFGLVLIEALASGTPIAAYPVEGPVDIWDGNMETGYLAEDLDMAIYSALNYGKQQACRKLALQYTWDNCTLHFLNNIVLHE
jgi:glycosyltransferase involved in cell wall biosynthesis